MFYGRILIVSDRHEVVAELEPIIRAGQHIASVVPDAREAMHLLDDGLVPDVMITDMGSEGGMQDIAYMRRFRELNQAGEHMVITEPGAPFSGPSAKANGRFSVLPRPFDARQVSGQVEGAVRRVEQEVNALRAEMWRSIDRLRREVDEAREEMIQVLARTIAVRDVYMYGHCERVAEMCRKVGMVMNLAEDDTRVLESAAQLHEIGKMSVPVELLQKTGPLSPEELEMIRSHARVGAEIVSGVASLKRIAPLIEHQVTDYADLKVHPDAPEHLLIGILRVVDAWDAMTSQRSYRGAMPRTYWEPFLRAGAGVRFHPEAVAALFRVLG